jgi:hypothetical protein
MSLKDQIRAQMLEDKKKAAREQALAEFDATEGMSTGEKMLAGIGQGMTNVARNVGNMVGLVDDEAMAEAKTIDQDLLDTDAGSAGSFVGEMAALAPLGGVGSVARGAAALPRALGVGKAVLPRAAGSGLPGAAAALTEGAAAGAILADPNERGAGALQGGAGGLVLNKTLGALGRKMTRGFDESAAAKEFGDQVADLTGRRPSLPLAQSAANATTAYPHRSVLSMFPLARGGSKKMEAKATQDFGEAALVQTFGKKNREAVQKAIAEADGDLVTAGQSLLKTLGNKGYAANRKALSNTLDNMKAGEIITPAKLDAGAKAVAKGDQRPFYSLTSSYAKLMEEPLEESTVSGRRAYNKIMNKVMPASFGAALSGGALPYLALTAGARTATAAPVQNFMMGRTALNRGMDAAGRAASPYAAAIRNTLVGQ